MEPTTWTDERLSDAFTRLTGDISKLDEKVEVSIAKLDAKIDASVAMLDAKIDASVANLDAKIERLDAKIDASVARLDERMDRLEAKLEAGFADLRAELRSDREWMRVEFAATNERISRLEHVLIAGLFAMMAAMLGVIATIVATA